MEEEDSGQERWPDAWRIQWMQGATREQQEQKEEGTWTSSGPPPSRNTSMVGVEREEEALEVDVRTEARGGAERRRERQLRARPLRAGGQGVEIRGGNEQL